MCKRAAASNAVACLLISDRDELQLAYPIISMTATRITGPSRHLLSLACWLFLGLLLTGCENGAASSSRPGASVRLPPEVRHGELLRLSTPETFQNRYWVTDWLRSSDPKGACIASQTPGSESFGAATNCYDAETIKTNRAAQSIRIGLEDYETVGLAGHNAVAVAIEGRQAPIDVIGALRTYAILTRQPPRQLYVRLKSGRFRPVNLAN